MTSNPTQPTRRTWRRGRVFPLFAADALIFVTKYFMPSSNLWESLRISPGIFIFFGIPAVILLTASLRRKAVLTEDTLIFYSIFRTYRLPLRHIIRVNRTSTGKQTVTFPRVAITMSDDRVVVTAALGWNDQTIQTIKDAVRAAGGQIREFL
ncbi:MAG TPA: hypothetical protein VG317_09070 [Pseudonocardiaceae bacterium]|jgi:hypothetical protein|nr:hypothetical protein [Pseudonocardiaceae bacterium]